MSMSNYLEKKLLDHVLGVAVYTPPANVYLALFTAAPSDTGGGTEVTGGSYARGQVPFAAAVSGAGTSSSSADVTFTNLPACTVVAVALMDAATGGNFLWTQTLTTSKTYTAGDPETVSAGGVVVSLD